MKRLCFLLLLASAATFSQVGIGTETPNATLEIKSTNEAAPAINDGLLIPKVEEFPLTNPGAGQDGMLVYATGSGSVSKGFYYWDNGTTAWVLATGAKNIDDLSDGKTDGTGSSVFLGINAGANDDGTNNQNIGIGFESLTNSISGTANVGVGHSTLQNNTTGYGNTAIGDYSLRQNTSGFLNTSLGAGALRTSTTGSNNITIGNRAGENITIGTNNVLIGQRAGVNTDASNMLMIENEQSFPNPASALVYGEFDTNTFRVNGTFEIGVPTSTGYSFPMLDGAANQVLQTDGAGAMSWTDPATGGAQNIDDLNDGISDGTGSSVFLGLNSGANDDGSANRNTAIGFSAMNSSVDGFSNIAFGHRSLFSNITGNYNLAIGADALYNTTGTRNVGVGHQTLLSNTSGNFNVALGANAGHYVQGDNNIFIGRSAGYVGSVHTKSGSVFLGNEAGYSETNSNRLYIENSNADANNALIYGEFDNDILRTNSTFQIGNPASGGYEFPIFDGTAAQLLQTDGSGSIGWVDYDAVGAQRLNDLDDGLSDNVGYAVLLGRRSGENTVDLIASRPVGVGYETLHNNTTGQYNTAVGFWSMYLNTTGSYNTAVGRRSLIANTIGDYNSAFGSGALVSNTQGDANSAVGGGSLASNTTGIDNSAMGYLTMYSNTVGNDNVAIGNSGLRNNVDGNGNVAIGKDALFENTSGSFNSATGFQALQENETGDTNVAHGHYALRFNLNGSSNTAIGSSALYSNISGIRNSALGGAAGTYSTGNDNLYLGSTSGYWISSGNRNVMVGVGAGAGTTVHSKTGSVFIGYEAGEQELSSNRLYIENSNTTSPLIYGEFDNNLVGINGALGIGHQAPQVPLHVENSGTSGNQTIVAALESNASNRPVLQFSESGSINLNAGMSIEYNGVGSGSANKMAINGVGGTSLFEFENGGDLTVLSGDLIIDGLGADREIKITDSGGNADRVLMRQNGSQDIYVGDIDNNGGDAYFRAGGSTELSIISGTGFIGVNTTTPAWTFEVNGNAAKPGGGSWINSSDRRLKKNVNKYADGLDQLLQIEPVTYQYNSISGFDESKAYVGVIAQDLQKITPYMVKKYSQKGGDFLAVDNSAMTYMLINAVKEQQQIIDILKAEMEELKNLLKSSQND